MTRPVRYSTAHGSFRSQNRRSRTVTGWPSRASRCSTSENAADCEPTVSISNHRPGISPRSRMAAAVAASPCGKSFALGTQSPCPLLQSASPALYQPASMTRIAHVRALQPVGDGDDLVVLRVAPGGTPFVEDDGQIVLDRRMRVRGALLHGGQPVAQVVQRTLHAGNDGGRRDERFAGREGLRPVAEFPVRQPAREADIVVLAVDFHLPASRPGQLRAPANPGLRVLHGDEGKPTPHRHRADLPEAFAERRRPAPGALQVQRLDALRFQPRLPRSRPSGTDARAAAPAHPPRRTG